MPKTTLIARLQILMEVAREDGLRHRYLRCRNALRTLGAVA